jgi:putative PIN family toxin of toxin-antitoxin system
MKPQVFIIDTNVLIAGLICSDKNSPTVKILDTMLSADFMYVLSPALLQEYRSVMMRSKIQQLHKLAEKEVDQLLSEITANAIWREPQKKHQAPDSGDNHLWDLLLQANNTVLITGDKLLLSNPPDNASVISARAFMETILG